MSSHKELTVYRTADPAVIQHFKDRLRERDEWVDRIYAFAKEVDPHREREPYATEGFGRGSLYGVTCVSEDYQKDSGSIPDGWLRQRGDRDYLRPRLSSKVGKQWQARIDEINPCPNARDLPGMPSMAGFFSAPGVELHEDGHGLYVLWRTPPEDGIDFTIWQRQPLSAYYTALEASDLRKAMEAAS